MMALTDHIARDVLAGAQWSERGGETMADYSFRDEAVSGALQAAKQPYEGENLLEADDVARTASPSLSLLAECIDVAIQDHKVCLNLPRGLGSHCLPIPLDISDGTAGQACLYTCTTFGIPTGVCVKVMVGGIVVAQQGFGLCSSC